MYRKIDDIPGFPKQALKLVQLLNSTDDMLAITSLDGSLLYLNKQGKILLETDASGELFFYNFHIEEDRQQIEQVVIPEVLKNGFWDGKNIFVTSGGSKRLLKQHIARVDGVDGQVFLVTLCRDITHTELGLSEQSASKQSVLKRERTYQTIFTRNIAGVYRCLVDGIVKECNDAFAYIFGYEKANDMIGTRSSNLYFRAEDRQKYLDDLMLNGRLTNYEIRHRRIDGKEVWVLVNAQLVEDEDGSQVIEGTMIDITAQHKMSADLITTVHKLREMGNNLRNAREMEAKRIARDLHDELGQLLTALKFEISLLKKMLRSDQREPIVKKTESIEDLLMESMKSVREIAKEIRSSGIEHEALEGVVEHLLQMFEERTDIITHLDTEEYNDELVEEEVKNAVFRIIQEALTNVARHAQATVLHVRLLTSEDVFQIEIRDNGVGIQQDIDKDNTLGVLGMKERVYTYNGNIDITNTGKGTEIKVVIPLHHDQYINS